MRCLKKFLAAKAEVYSHYVVIPHFIEGGENAYQVINSTPKEKLVLLDKKIAGFEGEFAAVYENFETDIYNALEKAIKPLSNYHSLKLIFPEKSSYPKEIKKGFVRFCHQYAYNHKVINDINKEEIQEGEVYIAVMEDDFVELIEMIITLKLKVGKHIGIVSYNETPLKKIILDGITTVSTDFQEMGTLPLRCFRRFTKTC